MLDYGYNLDIYMRRLYKSHRGYSLGAKRDLAATNMV